MDARIAAAEVVAKVKAASRADLYQLFQNIPGYDREIDVTKSSC